MHPLRIVGLLMIFHAVGLVGFVVYRDHQMKVAQGDSGGQQVTQGGLSVGTDPTGGRSSPKEILKRHESSEFHNRAMMLGIAAALGVVGVICTATVSGRDD
jgi:hypothetical protein